MRTWIALLFALTAVSACGGQDSIPLTVDARGRAISTLPLLIAKDQGLFEKHGLDVSLFMPEPDTPAGRVSPTAYEDFLIRVKRRFGRATDGIDISLAGGVPVMHRMMREPDAPRQIAIGSTDCVARLHIVGRKGLEIENLDGLAGMRLGASGYATTTYFVALLLAEHMGWTPNVDVTLVETNDLEALDDGSADVVFVYEREYAIAREAGYPILFDTAQWNEEFAGNSIIVERAWLEDPTHREAARRFLMAMGEAIALYHKDRALALSVGGEWNGWDAAFAEKLYERGAWLPRKPYPCRMGVESALALYADPALQADEKYQLPGVATRMPGEFYDPGIMQEIDATGFFDALYR